MRKNTVTLDIEDYNEMRDFNNDIQENHFHHYYRGFFGREATLYTLDDVVDDVIKCNEYVSLENKVLTRQLKELEDKTLNKFKEMSLWQFRNWKRKNK